MNFRLGLRGGAGMADYYSLIANAVAALDLNTEKARNRLYERARTALAPAGRANNGRIGRSG
jgi:hypothetical protein